jgi:phosphate/phosphite/phosphonate ABC transporter binding protein
MKHLLIAFFLLVFFNSSAQPVVLATYQYADNNRLENIRPLAKLLSDSLGLQVQVKSYPSVHEFVEGVQKNEVDVALINTFGYLLLEIAKVKNDMKPMAVLKVKEGTENNYKTAILARNDFPLDTVTHLKRIASDYNLGLVNIGSTSGNLIPRLKLAAIGIKTPEKKFKTVGYGENHKKAVDLLLAKQTDICAVGSTEYFNLLADADKSASVKLLWMSTEIPLGPVLFHNRLSEVVKQKMVEHFLKLDRTSPATLEAIKSGWSEAKQAEKFIKIDQLYYTDFKNQFDNPKAMENILKQFAN